MAVPSTFPTDLPERPTQQPAGGSWKERNCPGMRSCWSISFHSYSLKTSDKIVLARRICMIAILVIRTAVSVLTIIGHAWGGRLLSLIMGTIFAVIGFFFIAWCLAVIGDAKGTRKVFGFNVERLHFDIFLALFAVIHIGVFISAFFDNGGSLVSWLVMWLIIFGVAWIATWAPEPQPGGYV
ncbi:hypothetical protein B0J11DRAFT_281027 [Dendryphion nanum]|uniref:Uncharacterized protein n=1 Tax=Dendryphion nanum TaxID=256645 RepID=A0A9P9DVN4_9PLEO|nr:hypothetical protein B0J11DRAFT_281027 [Dendryphion nanum]